MPGSNIPAYNGGIAPLGHSANSVPYGNAAGVLSADAANLSYNDVTQTVTAKNLTVTSTLLASGSVSGPQPVILASVSGAGPTQLTAAQAGSLVVFDKADGAIYTLPAAAAGLWFDFVVNTTITSNSYKVITKTIATELMVGSLFNTDTDSASAVASWQSLVATANVAVTQAAAGTNATGGIAGSWFRCVCTSTTRWTVFGHILSAGTVATPFATS